MRQKIDYGIDLGTTNSAIARIERGEAVIVKSDDNQMDTTPSCVAYRKNKSIFVGLAAKSQTETEATVAYQQKKTSKPNSYQEFKRTMGTDHEYVSSFMEHAFSSEELSAEVLKKLRGYVRDESVESVVVTVPAMFRQNQLDATQAAAELAGFKYCELLQEPIAASIAYGIKVSSTSGHWLVFDFGGGTFDAALMHVDDGIMKVVDTEGDNHLGGKNIDAAIVDDLLLPAIEREASISEVLEDPLRKRLLQDALKSVAEQAKIALSSRPCWEHYLEGLPDEEGEEITMDLKVSLEQYEEVCKPIFQKAVDISIALLKRNGLSGKDLSRIILVGGPTFSQTLRGMLKEQVTPNVDSSSDPMTAVAVGAALFASTRTVPTGIQKRDETKAQLTLKYPETTVETAENLGVRVDRNKSSAALPAALYFELIRTDKGWSSGRVHLDGDAEVIEVLLNEGKPNQFEIKLSGGDGTAIPCEPSVITIMHGLKIASATLPRAVGLEVYDTTTGTQGVKAIPGLEKNTTLPASGKGIYKTAKNIRPGNKDDKIVLSFYEFDHGSDGSRAILNQPMGSFTLTGADLPSHLPAGSDIEVTVSFDASRRAKFSVYVPAVDETIEHGGARDIQKTEGAAKLLDELEEGKALLRLLDGTANAKIVAECSAQLEEMTRTLESRPDDIATTLAVREHLKKLFIALEKLTTEGQWPRVASELDEIFERLMVNNQRYGNEKSEELVAGYQRRVKQVKADENEKLAKQLIDELRSLNYALIQQDIGFWVQLLREMDQEYDVVDWTDKREARRLLNEAKQMIASNPSKAKTEQAVIALWDLMPEAKRDSGRRVSDELLRS